MKSSIQPDITYINICATDKGAHKYIEQIVTDLKRGNRQQYNNSRRL